MQSVVRHKTVLQHLVIVRKVILAQSANLTISTGLPLDPSRAVMRSARDFGIAIPARRHSPSQRHRSTASRAGTGRRSRCCSHTSTHH